MNEKISLKEAERKVFVAASQDGLWDIFIGCVFLMFAVVPLIAPSLGDFWGSMVFLPFWALVMLAIRLVRKHVIAPRVGVATLGPARKAKLKKLHTLMLVVNVVALAAGAYVAINFRTMQGQVIAAIFGVLILALFSTAAYYLDLRRLYFYGLLGAASPPVGELLYSYGNAPHHGFPITFGTTAGIIILTGLVIFVRLLRDSPVPTAGLPSEEV